MPPSMRCVHAVARVQERDRTVGNLALSSPLQVVVGAPASLSGLQAGDILKAVDGNSVEELGAELHDYICGPAVSTFG